MKISKLTHPLRGELKVPGDKSISHRAVMLGSLAQGDTEVSDFLEGADCLSTIDCFRKMGIDIEKTDHKIIIHGKGLHGLKKPYGILDCGNSGTTMRLISGILSGQSFESTLTGDQSIKKRPMNRIIRPLKLMGADIKSINSNDCAPLSIVGKQLNGIEYHSPLASAQVKSCILLAGLYADSPTSVTEPYVSRNHTELMLSYFEGDVKTLETTAMIQPEPHLKGQKVDVPGDISSAAYFIAAALMIPGSKILLKNVGINPTRSGIITVCKSMGGKIELINQRNDGYEPTADLLIQSSDLHGCVIGGGMIPTLIDEIPIIAVLASFASGITMIKDAQELKVKESNRLDIMVKELQAMGVNVEGTDDGMIIQGGNPMNGTEIESYLDHRIAMAFSIAGLVCEGETTIKHSNCIDISYPGFYKDLAELSQD